MEASYILPSGSGYDVRDWYLYKVDEPQDTTGMMVERKWHPSIHMPKEAARLFLRVTGVRAEKLHEIRERGPRSAEEEGFVNDIDLINGCGKSATRHFAELWDKTIKPTDRPVYGWEACPWVWVIEFERISREEAGA